MAQDCYDSQYGCWVQYLECSVEDIEEWYFPEVKYYYQEDEKVFGTKSIAEIKNIIKGLQEGYSSTIGMEFKIINTKTEFLKYWEEINS